MSPPDYCGCPCHLPNHQEDHPCAICLFIVCRSTKIDKGYSFVAL